MQIAFDPKTIYMNMSSSNEVGILRSRLRSRAIKGKSDFYELDMASLGTNALTGHTAWKIILGRLYLEDQSPHPRGKSLRKLFKHIVLNNWQMKE